MPSVLVETGFLTNKREGAYLNSKKGQNEMSKAIAIAIVNYKNELEKGLRIKSFLIAMKLQMKKLKPSLKNTIIFVLWFS